MRGLFASLLLVSLAACPSTTDIQWGRYDPEDQCWIMETVTVDRDDFPGWEVCHGGDSGMAVNLDGECVMFEPLCGDLDVPGLQPCEVVPGCCDRDLPFANPTDRVCD